MAFLIYCYRFCNTETNKLKSFLFSCWCGYHELNAFEKKCTDYNATIIIKGAHAKHYEGQTITVNLHCTNGRDWFRGLYFWIIIICHLFSLLSCWFNIIFINLLFNFSFFFIYSLSQFQQILFRQKKHQH